MADVNGLERPDMLRNEVTHTLRMYTKGGTRLAHLVEQGTLDRGFEPQAGHQPPATGVTQASAISVLVLSLDKWGGLCQEDI